MKYKTRSFTKLGFINQAPHPIFIILYYKRKKKIFTVLINATKSKVLKAGGYLI